MSQRGKFSQFLKLKLLALATANSRHDVMGRGLSLPDSKLRGGRTDGAITKRHDGAITHRPNVGRACNQQPGINLQPASLFR